MSKGGYAADVMAWADVVQMETIEKEDSGFAALKAEFLEAEGSVEDAEIKYSNARLRVARELAKGLPQPTLEELNDKEEKHVESMVDSAEQVLNKQQGKTGAKNASSLGGGGDWGETGRRKWLVARGYENRNIKAQKKARDILRGDARLKKMQQADMDQEVVGPETPAKEAVPDKSKEKASAATTSEAKAAEGAQLIANRLVSLNEHPDTHEKCRALVKVTAAGKESVYAFKPRDVVIDLRDRGVLAESVADDLLNFLASPPTKPPPPPPADWVANAKNVNLAECEEPAPFEDVETLFLRGLDEKLLAEAEAELEAAEKNLQTAWSKAEEVGARMNEICAQKGWSFFQEVTSPLDTELLEVDKPQKSHGSKNASATPDKIVSSERWQAQRDSEKRARDAAKVKRDAGRLKARDKRVDAIQMADQW